MLRLFFHLFFRHFQKKIILNSLNIMGFALGMTAVLVVIMYVDHEYSYDSFFSDTDQVFRLEALGNGDLWFANLGVEHARELEAGKYPEVEALIKLNATSRTFLHSGDRKFPESNVYQTSVGSAFFKVFDFELLEGERMSLFEKPHHAVITKTIAQKYFPDGSAIGKVLYRDTIPLTISGVISDLPTNTHFNFDILYTNPTLYDRSDHYHTQSYLKLAPMSDPVQLAEKIKEMDVALNEFHRLSDVTLMPVRDIYMESLASFGAGGKGDTLQLLMFMIMGALVLLITTTNYINLSLAIYMNKGREVGIRKILGEGQSSITNWMIAESVLTVMTGIPLILVGLYIVLPMVNIYLDVRLDNALLHGPGYIVLFSGYLLLTALLTVIFPVIMLGRSKLDVLVKSKSALKNLSGMKYRNALVLIQFIILFTLGISAWLMNRQIAFLDKKDMGFKAGNVIKIGNAFDIGDFENYELLKTRLLSYPGIEGVAFGPMMGDNMQPLSYRPEGHDVTYENLLSYGVDRDYFEVMGIDLLQGDFLTPLSSAEDGEIISLVNESFIRQYGWEQQPIGKKIILRPGSENELHRKVSAVFGDFHFFTLKEKITPQIISLRPDPQFVNTNILVRYEHMDYARAAHIIMDEWYGIQPQRPLVLHDMEEAVRRLYASEKQTSQFSVVFSVLAVTFSLLGLIGFIVLMIDLRSRELAMRRVLGASLPEIVRLLNRQLSRIILLAVVVGGVSSYYIVTLWLQDYAYKITIGPFVFIWAALIVYIIVFLISGIQSARSSRLDPVVVLKEE